jgi:hypothetical protein
MEKYQINFEEWSEESKHSFRYSALNSGIDYYSDEKYKCIACHKNSVFTAKDQKCSYEHEKNYIWQKRVLCPTCYQELQSIKASLAKLEEQLLNGNTDGLNEHISLLLKLPLYGRKINKSIETKIKSIQRKKA